MIGLYIHAYNIYVYINLPDMSLLPTSPFPKRWTSGPGNVDKQTGEGDDNGAAEVFRGPPNCKQ